MGEPGGERQAVASRLGLHVLVIATLVPCALWDTDWLYAVAAVLLAAQLFLDPTWSAATRTGQALIIAGYFAVYVAFSIAASDEKYPLLMAALAFLFVSFVFMATYRLAWRKLDAADRSN